MADSRGVDPHTNKVPTAFEAELEAALVYYPLLSKFWQRAGFPPPIPFGTTCFPNKAKTLLVHSLWPRALESNQIPFGTLRLAGEHSPRLLYSRLIRNSTNDINFIWLNKMFMISRTNHINFSHKNWYWIMDNIRITWLPTRFFHSIPILKICFWSTS